VAVIGILTSSTLDRCLLPAYQSAWASLVTAIGAAPSVLFVYADTMEGLYAGSGKVNRYVSDDPRLRDIQNSIREQIGEFPGGLYIRNRWQENNGIEELQDSTFMFHSDGGSFSAPHDRYFIVESLVNSWLEDRDKQGVDLFDKIAADGIDVIPYATRVERVVATEAFLDRVISGILMRVYIVSDHPKSDTLLSLFHLLRDYVGEVEGLDCTVESTRTDRGTLFVFRSNNPEASPEELQMASTRFEMLLELYRENPEEAVSLLASLGKSRKDSRILLDQYVNRLARIRLESKHTYEANVLRVRQNLEAEALSLGYSTESDMPLVADPSEGVGLIETTVAALQSGQIQEDPVYLDLLSLIESRSDPRNRLNLTTVLGLVGDRSISRVIREDARLQLNGFIYRSASFIGMTSVQEYVKFVNSLIST